MAQQVNEHEVKELMRRLSATRDSFGQPCITVREVAEITELPPVQIAKVLQQMRSKAPVHHPVAPVKDLEEVEKANDRRFLFSLMAVLVVLILLMILLGVGSSRF